MENSESHLVVCSCGHPEHTIILNRFKDDLKTVYINYHLSLDYKLIDRIISAIRHIFGRRSKYGDFGEVVLDAEEAKRIIEFLKLSVDAGENSPV